jgi:hypothetical protein
MFIVNGLFGGCTDIVSAIIDSSDVELYSEGMYINFTNDRELLNDGTIGPYSDEALEIAKSIATKFKSLQTNLEKRHIEPKSKKVVTGFKYIFVDPSSEKALSWINTRMQVLVPDFTMPSMGQVQNSSIILRYPADLVITLEDILEGKLIEKLTPFVDTPLDTRLYEAWLSLVKHDFPF